MNNYNQDDREGESPSGQRRGSFRYLEDLLEHETAEMRLESMMYGDDDEDEEEDDVGLTILRYESGEIGTFEEELDRLCKEYKLGQYSLSYSTDDTTDDSYLSNERGCDEEEDDVE